MLSSLSIESQKMVQAPNFKRMEEIDNELNSIFEVSQTLTVKQHRVVNYIKKEMDKIYMKSASEKIEEIYTQMDAIYKNSTLTKSDEHTLSNLEKEINTLFISSSSDDITAEDDKSLTVLNAELDTLYDARTLSLKDFERVDTLLHERKSFSNF